MNNQKPRCKRTCECGQKFRPSVEFGNERMCNACYKAHSRDFMAWFDRQSDAEQEAIMDRLIHIAIDLGVETPATAEAQEQTRVDAIAAELLADVEI